MGMCVGERRQIDVPPVRDIGRYRGDIWGDIGQVDVPPVRDRAGGGLRVGRGRDKRWTNGPPLLGSWELTRADGKPGGGVGGGWP